MLFVAGPVWPAVPIGLWLGATLVVTVVRRAMGHTVTCSLMYGTHRPLQLGELI